MRQPLVKRLGELRDAYIRDLDSRSAARKETIEVRGAKEDILIALTAIDPDPPASAMLTEQMDIKRQQLAQIEEKLALLDRIEFGDRTDLTADGTQRFKRSQLAGGTGVIGVIRGIVSALTGMMHFEDVITNARAMLLAERDLLRSQIAGYRQILTLESPAVLATRPHITPAKIAEGREETVDTAMADFARNTYLGKENYKNVGGTDEAHTAAMKSRILEFTGESLAAVGPDFTRGYAGEIAHTSAQAFGGPLIQEFLDHVPSFDVRADKSAAYMPTWGRNQLRWSEATDEKGGFFLDIETQVRTVQELSSGRFYAANPDSAATAPIAVPDEDIGRISSDGSVPPLFTIKARVRYTLAEGAARPVGQVKAIEIASRYPESYPFREADRAYVVDPTHLSAPAAGAGTAASSAPAHDSTPAAGGADAPLPSWTAAAAAHPAAPAPATGETADRDEGESGGPSGAKL